MGVRVPLSAPFISMTDLGAGVIMQPPSDCSLQFRLSVSTGLSMRSPDHLSHGWSDV